MQVDAGPILRTSPPRAARAVTAEPVARSEHGLRAALRAVPRSSRLLFAVLAGLLLMVVAYVLLPLAESTQEITYQVIATGALIVGFLGLKVHRPARSRGWLLLLLGYSGWVIGDLVWVLEQHLLPEQYPAPSDALYLSAYLLLGAGALIFVRTRHAGRDLSALLDAAILTTGAGVLVVVFLIVPLTHDSSLSPVAKAVISAYPFGDLFLLGVIARMYTAPGARTPSYRLLTASLALTLVADVVWNAAVTLTGETISSTWMDAGWLVAYLSIGAAACVPSMKTLAEPAPGRAETTLTRTRLTALSGGLLLPALVLLAEGATGHEVLWPVIGAGSLILSALVLIRMIGLLNVVQRQAQRLAALARTDALTGAPNRRSWDLELAQACERSQERGTSLSVAILDLDRFKSYNDSRGHQAGDRLLREAVAAWTEALPAEAVLARYGGEEFAILFPGATPERAAIAVERLRRLTPDGQTFSAGIAGWDPATDPSSAISTADQALYLAKRSGRDRVIVHGVDPQPGDPQPGEPNGALPAFTMLTQPIVDLASATVAGHEALTRFSGPPTALGVDEVFRQAHRHGYGDLLELAAIRAALVLDGRPDGHDLYVNASARALISERFLAGLPADLHGIVIELNEQTDDIELAAVAEVVVRLRDRGARIALDDVGAGAQEFARLATLRPDIVKIDRSLISGSAGDPARTAVIRALIGYAAELGLTTCAEGIEEVADLQHLSRLGITYAQGYLLARPGNDWHLSLGPLEVEAVPAHSL
jgi:diguanylate cyclase (GGDEF)-like protein